MITVMEIREYKTSGETHRNANLMTVTLDKKEKMFYTEHVRNDGEEYPAHKFLQRGADGAKR